MRDVVRTVAVVCAPAMAIVSRLIDSADDRRERARLSELNSLRRQLEDPTNEHVNKKGRQSHERD